MEAASSYMRAPTGSSSASTPALSRLRNTVRTMRPSYAAPALVGLRAGGLDDARPLLDLGADQRVELGGRGADRLHAELGHALGQLGAFDGARDVRGDSLHQLARRACRRDQAHHAERAYPRDGFSDELVVSRA